MTKRTYRNQFYIIFLQNQNPNVNKKFLTLSLIYLVLGKFCRQSLKSKSQSQDIIGKIWDGLQMPLWQTPRSMMRGQVSWARQQLSRWGMMALMALGEGAASRTPHHNVGIIRSRKTFCNRVNGRVIMVN